MSDHGRLLRRLAIAIGLGAFWLSGGILALVAVVATVLGAWAAIAWADRHRRGTQSARRSLQLPADWRRTQAKQYDSPHAGPVLSLASGSPPPGGWGPEITVATALLRRGQTWGMSAVRPHLTLTPTERQTWAAEAARLVGEAARHQDARCRGSASVSEASWHGLLNRSSELTTMWDTGAGRERLRASVHYRDHRVPADRRLLVLAAVIVVALLIAGGAVVTNARPGGGRAGDNPNTVDAEVSLAATVTGIVDGDTIDVLLDGKQRRVRLLNVDTPESVDPRSPIECLGPEATQALIALLPVGTEVELQYDEDRTDRYGRELAAVMLDGLLVNAELARQGLGVAVLVGDNDRFLQQVQAAQREAEGAQRGLFSEEVACTIPAQVGALEAASGAAPATPPAETASLADIDAQDVALAAVTEQALALRQLLDSEVSGLPLAAFDARVRTALDLRVANVQRSVAVAVAASAAVRTAVEERLQVEAENASRAAEAAAAAASAAAATPPSRPTSGGSTQGSAAGDSGPAPRASAPAPTSSGSGDSENGAPSGGGTYTGCRAYGPGGTSVDEQGRPYTKIDCSTRQPIG